MWMNIRGSVWAGMLYCTGMMECHQDGQHSISGGGEQWWPIIFLLPDGIDWNDLENMMNLVVATYCPALAWSGHDGARPWCAVMSKIRFLKADMVLALSPLINSIPVPPVRMKAAKGLEERDDDDMSVITNTTSTSTTASVIDSAASSHTTTTASSQTSTAGSSWVQLANSSLGGEWINLSDADADETASWINLSDADANETASWISLSDADACSSASGSRRRRWGNTMRVQDLD